jgi:hypothetical protein
LLSIYYLWLFWFSIWIFSSGKGQVFFRLDFRTVPTVCYFSTVPTVYYFRTVPTVCYFRTVPTVCYFRTVPTVCYFRTVPTVCYFRTVPIVCYFRTVPTVCYFRTVPIVCYSRTVPTVCYFRTVPTVCYFRTVPTVCYSRTVPTVCYFCIVLHCINSNLVITRYLLFLGWENRNTKRILSPCCKLLTKLFTYRCIEYTSLRAGIDIIAWMVIGTSCICRYKLNYYTIEETTVYYQVLILKSMKRKSQMIETRINIAY